MELGYTNAATYKISFAVHKKSNGIGVSRQQLFNDE